MGEIVERLTEMFLRFPGIGPRQARRFAYFLLGESPIWLDRLVASILTLKQTARRCDICCRLFALDNNSVASNCDWCRDPAHDSLLLMIVE